MQERVVRRRIWVPDGNDHPTYAHLSDERIAAALNHIVAELDGTREFAPSEIARRR